MGGIIEKKGKFKEGQPKPRIYKKNGKKQFYKLPQKKHTHTQSMEIIGWRGLVEEKGVKRKQIRCFQW